MQKKLTITENQFKQLLNEELGVSEMVADLSMSVYKKIEEEVKIKTDVETSDFYSKWNNSLTFDLFGGNVSCSITCYNFFTKEYYEYSGVVSTGWSVYVSDKLFFMGLTIPMISGQIVKSNVIDTIQHELSHLFEQKMMGKKYSDSNIYSFIKTNMESRNVIVSKTAQLMYGCIKSEQDSYVNGLYAYLMAKPEMPSMEIIKKSECWILYEKMCSIYNEFCDEQDFIKELKKYKMTPEKVMKLCDNFIKKIGKVLVKVKQDKYKKQGFREKN